MIVVLDNARYHHAVLLRPFLRQHAKLKWSLRDGPLRWVLIDVLHSARILVGRQVSE